MINPYIQYMYSYPHKTAYRPMSGVSLWDYKDKLKGPGHGLYLHIPFCQGKCGYCNLFSVTGANREAMERYLEVVWRQAEQYAGILKSQGTSFSSVTIGGGTPLCLQEAQLDQVFSRIESWFTLESGRDVVIETAPNQTDRG